QGVQTPPSKWNHVDQAEDRCRHSIANGTQGTQQADSPSAHTGVDFLDQDNQRDSRLSAREAAREYLEKYKGALGRGDRAETSEDGIADNGVEQQAPAPEHIGERRDEK